jgi:positive regulator of sigma E activity
MEEIGKIVGLVGTKAKIEINTKAACSHCAQANICNPLGQNKKEIELKNTLNAQVGDWVKIEIKEKNRIASLLVVLGIPIFLFVTGVIIGNIISGDKMSAILGGVGLLLAFLIVKLINNYLIRKDTDLAVIKEKVNPESCEPNN